MNIYLITLSCTLVSVLATSIADKEKVQVFANLNQQWLITMKGHNEEGAIVEIKSKRSNKCVDNSKFYTSNANPTVQFNCKNSSNQRWIIAVKGSYFYIKNLHSRKCISVASASKADGAKLRQWQCGSQEEHLWFYDSAGRLINKRSGKCMDNTGSTEDRVQLHQWTCN